MARGWHLSTPQNSHVKSLPTIFDRFFIHPNPFQDFVKIEYALGVQEAQHPHNDVPFHETVKHAQSKPKNLAEGKREK
jgi:hypothetical protein